MLSERAERFGGWIALTLFAIWLIASGGQAGAAAQGPPLPQQTQTLNQSQSSTAQEGWWPGDAPIIGGCGGALVAGIFAILIAQTYTKRMKQFEAMLEFSKRFHELIQEQRAMNRKYEENKKAACYDPKVDDEDAKAWWWRFFDLQLYEYDFYQEGLVDKGRFEEWMIWRWYDSHREPGKEWRTCGIDYVTGWNNWKENPEHGSRLIRLLNEIHKIPDCADKKQVHKRVRQLVRGRGPGFLKKTDLEKGNS